RSGRRNRRCTGRGKARPAKRRSRPMPPAAGGDRALATARLRRESTWRSVGAGLLVLDPVGRKLLPQQDVLQAHVLRQPVLAGWRGIFATDERFEIAAGGGRDPVSVAPDERLRQDLLVVCHLAERSGFDLPAIR